MTENPYQHQLTMCLVVASCSCDQGWRSRLPGLPTRLPKKSILARSAKKIDLVKMRLLKFSPEGKNWG